MSLTRATSPYVYGLLWVFFYFYAQNSLQTYPLSPVTNTYFTITHPFNYTLLLDIHRASLAPLIPLFLLSIFHLNRSASAFLIFALTAVSPLYLHPTAHIAAIDIFKGLLWTLCIQISATFTLSQRLTPVTTFLYLHLSALFLSLSPLLLRISDIALSLDEFYLPLITMQLLILPLSLLVCYKNL